MIRIKTLLLAALMIMPLSGCQTTISQPTLYEQLGQTDGIKAIVEEFINELLGTKSIEHHFNFTDLDNLHDKLVDQFCELSGGPCKYTGKEMKALHQSLDIDQAQFNALVEALMSAMDIQNVDIAVQNQLLALLVPMYKDIVKQ